MNVHVPYTQTGRMMAISTRLGQDVLLLDHLDVNEGVNGLFTITAAVKSQRDDLAAGDLIGSAVDFSLKLPDAGTRYWNGFVTDLHEGPLTNRGTRSYAMTVRPKLWLLSQRSNCRKFQNMTSPQVVEALCKEHGIVDLTLRITGSPPSLEYSVQWNENDLDYLLRRCQLDGLFYWFDHKQGAHTLIVADHYSGYSPSQPARVRYATGAAAQDHISEWRRTFSFTPGQRAGRDWDFMTMQAPQGDQTTFAKVPGNTDAQLYEFPGLFLDTTSAEQAMKARIQASETEFERVAAKSTVRTLAPGQTFTPYEEARTGQTFTPQVVTSIRHVAVDPTYETTGTGRPSYDNTFSVMPATTPATPHRTIPRPKIVGSQIALIAGPSGEEIFTEPYGRVKVWFPWDREAQKDGSDTPWIRVGQPWGGTTWGHQVIPRIGMEALVSYQEGDPDRPFVTAIVPDPTNPVPYTLPDNKTRMVFRSKSYKSSGNNEMTFEDATGGENQFFNASLLADEPRSRATSAPPSNVALRRLKALGAMSADEDFPAFLARAFHGPAPEALLRKTRTSRTNAKTDQGALAAWCGAVMLRADALVKPASAVVQASAASAAARELVRLSVFPDGPLRAGGALAQMGVVLVTLEHLPGTYLDGAAMLRADGTPVIAMTLRHDRLDNFWFTLLHEFCHASCHLTGATTLILDDLDLKGEDAREAEADAFAQDALISPKIWARRASLNMEAGEIFELAAEAAIHPAIVAGRWQRENGDYRRFSRMLGRGDVRRQFA